LPLPAEAPQPHPGLVLAEKEPASAFIELDGRRVFAYAVPLLDREGRASAVLAIYHLTDYLQEDIRRELRSLLISLLTGIIVTAGLVIFIVDRAVSHPIKRLIDQVTAIRRGDFRSRSRVPADGVQSDPAEPATVSGAPESSVEPPEDAAEGAAAAAAADAAAPQPADELGRLAAEFDRMAEDLARSREALLEEAEKRVTVERDLRHFERMATLGQLTSNLAHEVGTPLGVLRGRAECLASEFSDRPEARREVESIIAQIDRITRTIERYLSASRPSPATAERVVGDDLVREAAALVDLECRRHGIELEVKPAAGEAAILGHRDGLMQVLLNLAVNGIQSMESGGALRLASRLGELRGTVALELQVSDTGRGISEEVQKRIFEPFYSTRGTTGLGLFISRSIVREHGGATAVESEPGRGSTFLVRIPLVNGDRDGDGDGDGDGNRDGGGSATVTKGEGEECPPGMS
jgi:signal transduction histidine kinase